MASPGPSQKGQLKGFDFPDGVFEKLQQQGAELLARSDWVTTNDTNGFIQLRLNQSGQPHLAAGRGTFTDLTIDQCIDTMVVHMKDNCAVWDQTLLEVEVVDKWSDTDYLYAYKIDPGPLLSNRELLYYEAWRTDPTTGVVVNVSMSLPQYESLHPLPSGWVRGKIFIHYKRFTPVDNGKSTYYETLQQIQLGGCLPDFLVFWGVLRGLRIEFDGFAQLMRKEAAQ